MSKFAPVTDDDLARARSDPVFRQKLLNRNMEALLAGLKTARKTPSPTDGAAERIREGVQLAVRLAEMIQTPAKPLR